MSDEATPTALHAPIVEVTVHRNGAVVRRRGETTARRLELGGLPLLFAADSLRVRPSRGRVQGLRERCTLEAQPAPLPTEQLQRIDLQLQSQAQDDEDRTLGLQIQLLEKLAPAMPAASPRPRLPDGSAWEALSRTVRERLRALDAARADLQVRRRALARERAELDRRARPETAPPRFHRGLGFDLADAGDGLVSVEVEYFVEAARWLPAWRLELTGTAGRLHLEALVAQATGEDWSGAQMRFSTADLRRETSVPELLSWRLGPVQPPGRPAFRPLPPGLDDLFSGYDRARRAAPAGPPPSMALQGPPSGSPPITMTSLRASRDESEEREGASDASFQLDTAVSAPPPSPSVNRARSRAPAPGAPPPPPRQAAPMPTGAAMPPPPSMAMPPSPKSAMMASFDGGGGDTGAVPPPTPPLPPRLRYPWLRLAGADESHRGTLQPMDPFTQLFTLIEGQALAAPDQLRRALDGLREAASRVLRGPAPAGTIPLPEAHFQSSFRASALQSVPGDGQFHRLRVTEETATARSEFRCVPRESLDVWRYCVLEVPSEVPRPAGPLTVYRDGEFLVTSTLGTSDAGASAGAGAGAGSGAGAQTTLALNLGVEPDLRIVHRGVHLHQEDKGLMEKSTRVDHRISVRMRSTLPAPARLVIYDRLPVPAEGRQELSVQLVESQPPPTRTDRGPRGESLDGGLHWTVELAPGEHTAVEFMYRVTLPARFELEGGNRRES